MATRGVSYSNAEDILLSQVYMQISQDPVIGVYQSSENFWDQVDKGYKEGKKQNWEYRTVRSLQARVQSILKAIKKFHGCISAIESRHQSGASNADIMQQAEELLKEDQHYRSGWKFNHVWHILKDFEKFQDGIQSSRQHPRGNHSSESETQTLNSLDSTGLSPFSINLDDDNQNIVGGSSSSSRPIGVKKAKMKKKQSEDTTSLIAAMQKQNEQLAEDMKTTNARLEHHLAIQTKSHALKEMKEENKILYMDLSSIQDPHVRAFTKAERRRILQKRAQQQGRPNPFETGTYSSYFNNIGGFDSGLPDY